MTDWIKKTPRLVVGDYPVPVSNAKLAVRILKAKPSLFSNQPLYFSTMGIALYHSGEFKESLDTVIRSAVLNANSNPGDQPADWAFVAACYHQLGYSDNSRVARAKCRDFMQKPTHMDDAESQSFLREAEALIDPAPAPK